MKEALIFVVAEELQLSGHGYSDSQLGRSEGRRALGIASGKGVSAICFSGCFEDGVGVSGGEREDGDAIEGTAGMRPDPAVSVPRENVTSPLATATAEPELDPPEM